MFIYITPFMTTESRLIAIYNNLPRCMGTHTHTQQTSRTLYKTHYHFSLSHHIQTGTKSVIATAPLTTYKPMYPQMCWYQNV